MSEPTREQRIQQANLQFDYDEATKRGECWENWQCRPWSSPNVWHDIYCTPFGNVIDCEYRRKPEPSKPIVASVEGMINYAGKLVYFATGVYEIADLYDERLADVAEVNKGQRASLTLTIYPEGCEVSDTVTVPRAVVDRLLGCYCDSPYSSHPDLRAHLDKLAEAVKGGGE